MPAMLAASLLALVAATAVSAEAVDRSDHIGFVVATLAAGIAYLAAGAIVLVRGRARCAAGSSLVLVLAVAAVLRGLAMTPAPNLSTDAFRYVWDGRVQAAGFSPYTHVPADPALAQLRDATVYPHINQKERAVTIYPPAAEMIFRAAHWLGDSVYAVRVVMLGFDAVTIAALLALLARLGLPLAWVAFYAWHPLPLWEFAGHGHIDAAATALIVLGLLAAFSARQAATGAIFATAALVKYFPLVLLPALWRRWDWRLPLALATTAVVLYLPYIGQAGTGVLGFLGQHLDNEGYAAGWGFHPVWLLRDFGLGDVSGRTYTLGALAILGCLAGYALFARGVDEIQPGRIMLLGAAFVFLTSPHYAWYFAFLVALLPLAPHPAAFAFTLLAPLLYLPQPPRGLSLTTIYLIVFWLPLAVLVLMEGRGFSARLAARCGCRGAGSRSSGSGS